MNSLESARAASATYRNWYRTDGHNMSSLYPARQITGTFRLRPLNPECDTHPTRRTAVPTPRLQAIALRTGHYTLGFGADRPLARTVRGQEALGASRCPICEKVACNDPAGHHKNQCLRASFNTTFSALMECQRRGTGGVWHVSIPKRRQIGWSPRQGLAPRSAPD
jgi:hypothetical protein